MVKFDGGSVSGAGAPKGTDPLLYQSGESEQVSGTRGRQQGAFGYGFNDGDIGDGFGSEKEPLSQEDVAAIKSLTTKFNNAKTIDQFNDVYYGDDYSDLLMTLDSSNVQFTPDQEKIVANFYKALNTSSMRFLNATANKNFTDFSGDVSIALEDMAGRIGLQLTEKNMTQSERNVLSALKDVLNGNKSYDEAAQGLTQQEKKALEAAYDSSDRSVIKTRLAFGDNESVYMDQVHDGNYKDKEMIYWVKNAYNDFGLNDKNGKHSKVMSHLVDVAVSEMLYAGNMGRTSAQALKDTEFLYQLAHTSKTSPESVLATSLVDRDSDGDYVSGDDAASLSRAHGDIARGELPSKEAVKKYHKARSYDPAGGQQGTYGGFLKGMLEVVAPGESDRILRENNPPKKNTIRRKLD